MGSCLYNSFPGDSLGNESACNAENPGSVPGWERSLVEGSGNTPLHSYPETPWTEEPSGQQPTGCKESDLTATKP